MRLAVYSLLRVAVLLVTVGLLYALGMRSWLLWVVGILAAALISYLVLPRQRDAAAEEVARQVGRRRNREPAAASSTTDDSYEDAIVDELNGGAPSSGTAAPSPDAPSPHPHGATSPSSATGTTGTGGGTGTGTG